MSKFEKEEIKESFNEDFCVELEYHLTRTFGNSELKGFWCDGISMPSEIQLSKKRINDQRKILTKAWLGFDGQDEYEMIVHFGRCSLRRYAKGTGLTDCLPSEDSLDWIALDQETKTIELNLR